MKLQEKLYTWWKKQHVSIRKPLVFIFGILLVISAPLIGWLPGPGGIVLFLLGIAVLASEFDWAEVLKEFFLKTVPKEVKNRWRPTPRWEYVFDGTALALLVGAIIATYNEWWGIVLSLGFSGICLFLFNRDRLTRLKKRLRRK